MSVLLEYLNIFFFSMFTEGITYINMAEKSSSVFTYIHGRFLVTFLGKSILVNGIIQGTVNDWNTRQESVHEIIRERYLFLLHSCCTH